MAFNKRVEALRINPQAIDRVEVLDGSNFSFPSKEGKFASVQIYAAITSNDGYISPDGAKQGLDVYGKELREESRINPGKHPAIDKLEEIAKSGKLVRVNLHRKLGIKKVPKHISEKIDEVVERYCTNERGELVRAAYIIDEQGIRESARRFNQAYSWAPGFKNYFAVKPFPNHFILKILKQEGMGVDCSSEPELDRAIRVGLGGDDVFCTSNHKPTDIYRKAREMGAVINLDDITHIEILEKSRIIPKRICFRYNPGSLREGNDIIGNPEEAKYGLTNEQLPEAIKRVKKLGVEFVDLHTMIVSNMLDENYLIETGKMMFEKALEMEKETGVRIKRVNLGGGHGLAYKPEEIPVDLAKVSTGLRQKYNELIKGTKLDPLEVVMENGRWITGQDGYLLLPVTHVEEKYRNIVGVAGSQEDNPRPARYTAYHHITVHGKENQQHNFVADVVGGLCENCDKFAINRLLPEVTPGDVIVQHHVGAHAPAMGGKYNDSLKGGIVLIREDDSLRLIREHETKEDLWRNECLESLDSF